MSLMRIVVILLIVCSGCSDHVNSRGYIISQSPKEEPKTDGLAISEEDES